MATELTPEEQALKAYEAANASLKDYDPSKLSDDEKVKEWRGITYTGDFRADRPEEAEKEPLDVPVVVPVDHSHDVKKK